MYQSVSLNNDSFKMSQIKKIFCTSAARKIKEKKNKTKQNKANMISDFVAVLSVDYVSRKGHCKVLKLFHLSSLKSHERTWLSEGAEQSTFSKSAILHHEH